MVKPIPDIENAEHNENQDAKKVILFGKTTSGSYIELKVKSDGTVENG